jgi:hypothetical protein
MAGTVETCARRILRVDCIAECRTQKRNQHCGALCVIAAKYLDRYLSDRRLEISNNRAERSIKPFVIDRKNFLFANTPRGAKASAIMFSLIETAKENGLNPFNYLVYVFENAPNRNIRNDPDALEQFLPAFVPSYIRTAGNSCPSV